MAADNPAPPEPVPPAVGDPVPRFGAPDLDGKVFTVSKMLAELAAGDGCVAFVFFTTVCEPCKREIARMKAESARLSDAGVQTILISAGESGGRVRSMVERIGVPFRTVTDSYMEISRLFGLTTSRLTVSVPRTFVVGADGRIRKVIDSPGDDVVDTVISSCRSILPPVR